MKQHIYYTVIIGRQSCTVKYAVGPKYEMETLTGAFADPGEASREIKKALQGKLEYLPVKTFQAKVEQLASHYSRDLARLADWNIGNPIRL